MITIFIYFIVILILIAVAYYAITNLVPAEAQKFFMVLLVLISALAVIWLLLSATGHGGGLGLPSMR
jgi:hypothetical protein